MANVIGYQTIRNSLSLIEQAKIFGLHKWTQPADKLGTAIGAANNGIYRPIAQAMRDHNAEQQIVDALNQGNMSSEARHGVMTSYLIGSQLEQIFFGTDPRQTTPLMRELLMFRLKQWTNPDKRLVRNFLENPYGQGTAALADYVKTNKIAATQRDRLFDALLRTSYQPAGKDKAISIMYPN